MGIFRKQKRKIIQLPYQDFEPSIFNRNKSYKKHPLNVAPDKGPAAEISLCQYCVHRHATGTNCEAFPNGIPHGILFGELDHREPIDGDNDVQFVVKPGFEKYVR